MFFSMSPNNNPLDIDLENTMDTVMMFLKNLGAPLTDDQLRMQIVGHNLQGLAQTLLIADENDNIHVNIKQLVLGILGTAAWLTKDLPDFDFALPGDTEEYRNPEEGNDEQSL